MGATTMLLVVIFRIVLFQAPDQPGVSQAVIGLAAGIAVVIGAAWPMYAMKLTVRVDDTGLHVRFFPLVERDIPLEEIARWEARTYRPILEYCGWGICCGWKGMAYNVSCKRLLIGSLRPNELAAVTSQAKQHGG